MYQIIRKAFTLIELLVVIAIIGILSGLIVVSMSGVTDKANIAKAQVFSNSLRNSLMLNLVSEWKLDEVDTPSTNKTPDSWGENDCTLSDSGGACSSTLCPQLKTTGCVDKNCLSFNGTGSYLDCGSGSNLSFTDAFSVEMWIYPYTTTAGYTFLIKKQTPGYDIYINPTGGIATEIYQYLDTTWKYSGCGAGLTFSPEKYYHIIMAFQKASFIRFYINGVMTKECAPAYNNPVGTSSGHFYIGYQGWWGSGNAFYKGLIDGVRVYDKAVPAPQALENYYIGLNGLLASGGISLEEYKERVGLVAVNKR